MELIRSLENILNLSKNEARVYAALLRNPALSVIELSNMLELPRSRIYQVLSSLAAQDLISKSVGSAHYTVIPPQDALDLYIERLDKEHSLHKQGIQELSGLLKEIWRGSIVDEYSPGVELIPYAYIENTFLDAIKDARDIVFIAASSDIPVVDWKKAGNALSNGYERNLKVRYLVNSRDVFDRLQRVFEKFSPFSQIPFELRYSDELSASFVLVDERLFLMFFGKDQQSTMVLHTSSSQLKSTFRWLYDRLWEEGEQPSSK